VNQYRSLFEMENCELTFTETALRRIAERAKEKETGARGLRSIIEELMTDIMYELPEQTPGGKYVITEEIVEGRNSLFALTEPKTKSA